MSDLSETPFRVYMLDSKGKPHLLGAADDASLGDLLIASRQRLAEGEPMNRHSPIGVLYRPIEGEPGEWIVNPWNHGPPSYRAFGITQDPT